MKGLELIKQAMALQEVERVPWVPFVGVHAGYLLGVSAEEYLKSKELIVKGVGAAIEKYNPDGIPVVFDLQLEAEAMGCKIVWADENPPSVQSHPLAEGVALESIKVPDCEGRIAVVMEAAAQLRRENPDIALYGLITGPFTLALHLLGTDIFMKMFDDERYIHDLMTFTTKVCNRMTDLYRQAGCDVIAVVDPMTSQIGPDQFEQFVSKSCREVFDHIKAAGMKASFFVCGHAQHNIEVMCDCKPDNISIDENIPLDYVRDICLSKGISFGGNMLLTVGLLMGSPEDCERNAVSCMDTGGKRGFILSPGCDVAYSTPEANLAAVSRIVHDPYRQDTIRATEGAGLVVEPIDLVAYANGDRVKVDIITLDSASCAPCQYMVAAVAKAVEGLDATVTVTEHKVKEMSGVEMMVRLGVKNIPTICIDGEVKFISNIPPVGDIRAAIEARIAQK